MFPFILIPLAFSSYFIFSTDTLCWVGSQNYSVMDWIVSLPHFCAEEQIPRTWEYNLR